MRMEGGEAHYLHLFHLEYRSDSVQRFIRKIDDQSFGCAVEIHRSITKQFYLTYLPGIKVIPLRQ